MKNEKIIDFELQRTLKEIGIWIENSVIKMTDMDIEQIMKYKEKLDPLLKRFNEILDGDSAEMLDKLKFLLSTMEKIH